MTMTMTVTVTVTVVATNAISLGSHIVRHTVVSKKSHSMHCHFDGSSNST